MNLLKVFEPKEYLEGVRKCNHVRYSLWRFKSGDRWIWNWRLDSGVVVSKNYWSLETADWEFGSWLI